VFLPVFVVSFWKILSKMRAAGFAGNLQRMEIVLDKDLNLMVSYDFIDYFSGQALILR